LFVKYIPNAQKCLLYLYKSKTLNTFLYDSIYKKIKDQTDALNDLKMSTT
jgi:hypothetical protein